MQIEKNALGIINDITAAGEEAIVVGGCVRDSVYNEIYKTDKVPKDWDIATSMRPDDVVLTFKKKGYNVVPTGIKHGTVTVFPKGCIEGYEVTTYRIDGTYEDGRHPDSVVFASSFKEDASRRDFTINAMGCMADGTIIDFFGGIEDLKKGIIRTVGEPDDRFREDALRMMRAVRFSAQLGFTLHDGVKESIIKNCESISLVSKERVRDELCKILMSDNPQKIEVLYNTGLLKQILPELHVCFQTAQNNNWHLYDVGTHTMVALMESEKDLTLRLSIMLHDIGKPPCKTAENGIDHFYGHPDVSAEMAETVMRRLKFTAREVADVVKLVSIHDVRFEPSKKSIKRFINRYELDDRMFRLYLKLSTADSRGQNLNLSAERLDVIQKTLLIYETVEEEPMSVKSLAVNGYDVMEKGYRGREIGQVLENLLEAVIEDPSLNTKETLMSMM